MSKPETIELVVYITFIMMYCIIALGVLLNPDDNDLNKKAAIAIFWPLFMARSIYRGFISAWKD